MNDDVEARLAEVERALDERVADPEFPWNEALDERDTLIQQQRHAEADRKAEAGRKAEAARQVESATAAIRAEIDRLGPQPDPDDEGALRQWVAERDLLTEDLGEATRRAPFAALQDDALQAEQDRLELAFEDGESELARVIGERGPASARARLVQQRLNALAAERIEVGHEVQARVDERGKSEAFAAIAVQRAQRQLASEDRYHRDRVRREGTRVEQAEAEEEAAKPITERKRGRELLRFYSSMQEWESKNRRRSHRGLAPTLGPAWPESSAGAPMPAEELDRMMREDPDAALAELRSRETVAPLPRIFGDWVPPAR